MYSIKEHGKALETTLKVVMPSWGDLLHYRAAKQLIPATAGLWSCFVSGLVYVRKIILVVNRLCHFPISVKSTF